ncbi:hypothetical protein T12_12094 [Trichinella patagoniensis]|uniref:Uncharacterized protein n=1 Tax=Trichinella patagoniensis TaxID=990121 RepID=A0A0V1A8J7_9BILA|nr:hypothetical protein T12_12094 [Trichinella patagoniensis]
MSIGEILLLALDNYGILIDFNYYKLGAAAGRKQGWQVSFPGFLFDSTSEVDTIDKG